MDAHWTRRHFLIGSALLLGGCMRDYGTARAAADPDSRPVDRPQVPGSPQSSGPVAGPDGPVEPRPVDLPRPVSGGYVIVPRSAWTTRPVGGNNYAMNGITRITVHHTGEHEGLIGLPDIEVVRRIENYHRNGRHWPAIGYHYLIGKDGRVYEGRPVHYQGAHVSSENEHNLGISMVGDFQNRLPNAEQLAVLAKFLNDQRTRFRVGKSRVYGHRDLNKSICPGEALYTWLKKTYYKAA
jgi:N-acetylmuramoyl-L-alanine amidase